MLAGGATDGRDLPIPGRELDGIHQAMEYLPWSNRVQQGDEVLDDDGQPPITAKGKKVVIIGGGDTGADCLGTAHRQGAASVHQFEIMPRPPETRADSTPWPTYPLMFRVSSAHEEGGERVFSVNTEEFVGADGHVTALKVHEVEMNAGKFEKVEGTDFELDADLVLLAMGFVGPEKPGLLDRPRRRADRPRQRGPGRRLPDVGAGRVRGRRHGPRPVADRVGDRRGSGRRRRRGPLPDGSDRAAGADQADRRAAAMSACAKSRWSR